MPGSMLPNSRSSFRSVPAVGNTSMGMAQPDTHQTIVAPSENAIIPTESVNNINFSGGGAGTSIAGNPMYSEGNPARLGTLSTGDPVSPFRTGNPMASFPSETMRQEILLREQNPNVYQEMQPLGGSSIPAQDSVMPQAAYTMQAPSGNYGLSGAEQALQAALGAQAGALTQGAYDAFGTLERGANTARVDIGSGLSSGISGLRAGLSTGRGDITQASEGAISRFNPYEETGRTALDKEAAFSGALGREAQAQAFADYQASPGQQWLQQQQEQSLLRNAAATGGTQSGNVLSALQEQAAGRASQNYQQDLGNLRSLAQRGQSAADSQAGIQSQAGCDLAQMEMQSAQSALQAKIQAAQAKAQMAMQRGSSQAQLQQSLGQNLSNIYGSTGSNLASLRYGAGQDVANQLGMTGQQLAQLQSGQGSALAGIDQQTAANIANLAAQQGQQTSGLRTDLATILANLATGSGSQQSNLALQMGNAQAGGVTNPWGNTASSISGLIASNPQLISNMLPAYNQQT
ncbi:MAG: hypothetical protein GY881_09445, partial [Gammaproteobacteria bacterium]|nr:hypothetical protein [Gammaproteobacteria bacterium]